MIRRTLLEWQSLPYGSGDKAVPAWAADRIAAVARRSPLAGKNGNNILVEGRQGLAARQIVGVIVADGCALEILPKIETGVRGAEASKAYLRSKLVHMLAVALNLELDHGAVTWLSTQDDTILEMLIGIFARKLAGAMRQGMPRHYVACEEDRSALRGRLDMVRQFTRLAASPQRLACRFDELSNDIALNQIMKAAVTRLRRVARSIENQRLLAELAFAYADISEVPVKQLRFADVHLDRTNERWRDLLALGRLLLGDRFQTSSMGGAEGFSLLFEMNTLFEEYVGRLLGRALVGSGLSVSLQGGRLFCLEDEADGRKLFQTRPDILVRRSNEIVHIIDTKWKRISPRVDDAKQGVSQSDIYQMMAYGQVYGCERLMLLYPHHHGLDGRPGARSAHRVGAARHRLEVSTIELSTRGGVIEQLRDLFIGLDSEKLYPRARDVAV